MPLTFDPECQAAIDLAKWSTADGATLDVGVLLAALFHATALRGRYPQLERYLKAPQPQRDHVPQKVSLAPELRPVFQQLAEGGRAVSPDELFNRVLELDAGRSFLLQQGMTESDWRNLQATASASPSAWRASPARAAAIKALGSYGRMLTEVEPPHGGVVERETTIRALMRILSKMKRRNAIIVGPAGSGKSAIVYELARRLYHQDPSLPPRLRDMDIFELSPSFLRSGASMVGQYDERVKALIEVLQAHPKIVLFVDEIHSLFQSGVHERGPFTDANESFKAALGRGEITCLGCTTPAEYRHAIEPDKALERRFSVLRLDPPSREATLAILGARRPRLEVYYTPLRIPDEVLERAIALTDTYLPGRYQPDKAIQLLDEACAFCATADPPVEVVGEESLMQAIEDVIGHPAARAETITERGLQDELCAKIVGQDDVLGGIAGAFVGGLGEWSQRSGPRGVYLFGGPTGTGKTETALLLAKVLGGGRDSLVRVDCNTLPPSVQDSGPVLNRLLGVPPGYVGYARGQGGLLSGIRDLPESVVLFDEFEKAGPVVARLVLQIIDDGRVDDVDGNRLDFRRAYIIFTTNAGCGATSRHIGFDPTAEPGSSKADIDDVKRELRLLGLGDEFLARVSHFFMFKALRRQDIELILGRQLAALRERSLARGLELSWSADLIMHLAAAWQPQFGVRFAVAVLRNRITEQLDVASAQGEMKDVKRIILQVIMGARTESHHPPAGVVERSRDGDALVISLA
jgi:ATP-dependent Clp protease ATP-binding subunit ClpA